MQSNTLKRLFAAICTLFCLTALSCSFENDIEEETHTTYTFFASQESGAVSREKEYEIGSSLNSLPDFLQDGINIFKTGYYIDSWSYWKNPITQSEEKPSWITADKNGKVQSISVHPAKAYFYVSNYLPVTYYVRFNANGGDGTMKNQTFTYDDEAKALSENLFTRSAYDFKGWGLTSKDTAVSYCDKAEVSNLSAKKDGIFDLYAIWWKKSITIKFDSNGGSGTMSDISASVDETTLPLNTFTKTGYHFTSWLSSNNITFSDGELLTEAKWPNDDATLYAQWEADTYTLTLDKNDGSGETSTQTYSYGEEQAISTPFTRTGYDFAGWATSAGGAVEYTANQSLSLTADKTLYAVWTEQSLTVNYDANGGSGSMSSQTTTYTGSPIIIKANAFTKDGYKFSCYQGSNGLVYNAGDTINQANWVSGELTLSAVWTPKATVSDNTNTAGTTTTPTSTGITFTASTGYTLYIWVIDGSIVQSTSSNTYTVLYENYSSGSHSIVCSCINGTLTAEYAATFTVE